jgi:hypothetical protein
LVTFARVFRVFDALFSPVEEAHEGRHDVCLAENNAECSRAAAVKTSKYRPKEMPADGTMIASTGSSAPSLAAK